MSGGDQLPQHTRNFSSVGGLLNVTDKYARLSFGLLSFTSISMIPGMGGKNLISIRFMLANGIYIGCAGEVY